VVVGQKLVKKLTNTQSIVLERLKGLINLIKSAGKYPLMMLLQEHITPTND